MTWRQTTLDSQTTKPYAGRFVCWDCAEELYPVRIGVWRCGACGRQGVIGLDGPFVVLTFEVHTQLDIEFAHQVDTKWAIRHAIDRDEPVMVP